MTPFDARTAHEPAPRRFSAGAWLALLLIVGSVIIFQPALHGSFLWDDDVHFTANRDVARWKGIIDIWTSRHAVYYPLVLSTGWAIHKVAGFNPVVFHSVTLAFHVASALLLVAVLRRWRIPGAWLAGFLFAWHPMQVESAAWICELKNTQSAFFLFASVLALQRSGFFEAPFAVTTSAKRWHWFSVALFALAVLSKPSVVMVPVVLALVVWWKRGVRRWTDIDELFPYLIISLLASGWTVWEQRYSSGASGFEWSIPVVERLVLSGQIAGFYFAKLAWPANVMFIYPKWEIASGSFTSWLPLAALFMALTGLWLARARVGRGPFVVLASFAALIFPLTGFFNVYFMRYAWVSDHFVYLAAIPLFAGASALLARSERLHRIAPALVGAVLMAVSAWFSHGHAATFRDAETLWRHTLDRNQTAWIAHNNLGLILRDRGDLVSAQRHFEDALRDNPEHYEAMNNLGALHHLRGEHDLALNYFDRALALRPELYDCWVNRGNLLRDRGDVQGAYDSYARAAEVQPGMEAAWVNTALLAESQLDGARAGEAYKRLLTMKKLSPAEIGGFLYERAYKSSQMGRYELAHQLLDQAAALSPGLADIYLLQGTILENQGQYSAAEKMYRKALSIRSDWGAVLLRLAILLSAHPDPAQRNPKEALSMTEAMMQAGGDRYGGILDAYAMALAASGRFGEAMQAQQRALDAAPADSERTAMNLRFQLYQQGQSYTLPAASNAKP